MRSWTAFCARPSIRDTDIGSGAVSRSAEDMDANAAQMPVPALPLTQDPLPEGEQREATALVRASFTCVFLVGRSSRVEI